MSLTQAEERISSLEGTERIEPPVVRLRVVEHCARFIQETGYSVLPAALTPEILLNEMYTMCDRFTRMREEVGVLVGQEKMEKMFGTEAATRAFYLSQQSLLRQDLGM